ncbi:peptidase U32 family protein [Ichthyobacterium seriolicida]|uniref:Collagenase n=1 Tax=Ichthyobacterium seriolicida TaxID=242600 RepID=A0A1J1DZH7_9FLAO|nr:peptidase U32 family protein [Ichthyobacterium seriolicida]BAV95319.1 collagenase precursor [Ichthyobacterium seriolicida]
MSDKKIELMAPAGNFDSLQAALDNGADSIYFGVDQLNMRARSSINFVLDDLEEIVSRCGLKGVKSYLTLNTIIYDNDLYVIKTLINKAKEVGITAVIASDQAVINYAFSQNMEVHISTQLNITNIETVKFYSNFADTMVLSRELSLSQIAKITKQIKVQQIKGPSGNLIEIEIFGHGALCVAVSGKCYMSLHTYNSSANRGACKQNCRKKYTVIDKESGVELEIDNEYIMSPKDLCTIDIIDQVIGSGINILKIEGRGRAPEYVSKVISQYREAIDDYYLGNYSVEKVNNWITELKKVYNREFWSGYYLGQKLGEFSKHSGSHATQKKVFVGRGYHYYSDARIGEFEINACDVAVGDNLITIGPTTGVKEFKVKSIMVNDEIVDVAKKGNRCTIPVDFIIRSSDRLYKIMEV